MMSSLYRKIRRYLEAEWSRRFGHVSPREYDPGPEFAAAIGRINRFLKPGSFISSEEIGASYDVIAPHEEVLSMIDLENEAHKIAYTVELIEGRRPRRVIDAGCGVGLTLGFLSGAFPKVQFIGYDVSPQSVERARQRLARLRCSNAETLVCEHQKAGEKIGTAIADLVFTKGSFGSGNELVPNYTTFADLEEWKGLMERDSAMGRRRVDLNSFAMMLRPGGVYLNLQAVTAAEHFVFVSQLYELGLVEVQKARRLFPSPMKEKLLGYLSHGLLGRPFTDAMLFKRS